MRRLLGVLRRSDDDAGLAPQPGLEQLDALVAERARRRACRSSCASRASREPLPPGVDLSAYRIVQEALTNALKHAGAARAARRVCATAPDELELEVVDDGRGDRPPAAAAGTACVGMRERAALVRRRRSRPGRGRAAASRCAPAAGRPAVSIRVLIADDQALVRTGFRDDPRVRARHRGRRRGRRRRARRSSARAGCAPTSC